jgi:hypothetical protein
MRTALQMNAGCKDREGRHVSSTLTYSYLRLVGKSQPKLLLLATFGFLAATAIDESGDRGGYGSDKC